MLNFGKKYEIKPVGIVAAVLVLGLIGSINNRSTVSADHENYDESKSTTVSTDRDEKETTTSEQPLIDYADNIRGYTLWSGGGKKLGEMGYIEISHAEFLNIDGDEVFEFMEKYYPHLKEQYNYVIVRSSMDEGMIINNSEIIDVGIVKHSGVPRLRENEQFYNSVDSPDGVSRYWKRDRENNTFIYIEEKE